MPPSQDARLQRRQRILAVRCLLAELKPNRDREILFRFYIEEEEKDQICAELGLSADHFKRVLYRARRRFRKLLLDSPRQPS